MCKDYNLKISTGRTKIMAFKGKHLVRSKIEIDGSILEQVKQINYLGCELSLDGEPGFDKKINRFQGICGTIRKHLKKTPTDTQMKFYKVVARPSLLYGSETWVTMKRDMTCWKLHIRIFCGWRWSCGHSCSSTGFCGGGGDGGGGDGCDCDGRRVGGGGICSYVGCG